MKKCIYWFLLILAGFGGGGAYGSSHLITNGDFEAGDLTGWIVRPTSNGKTDLQDVVPYDIDGAGPLGTSMAARFDVSQVSFVDGVPAGIELVQNTALIENAEYTLSADLSVLRPIAADNLFGGLFELIVDGIVLDTYDAGSITGMVAEFGNVLANFTPNSSGMVEIGLRITRPATAAIIHQFVDNIEVFGPTVLDIEIKPGRGQNSVNPFSTQKIPVAILTTDTFYALDVNFETVEFGPGGATESHGRAHVNDVDRDGDMDLVLHFNAQDTGIGCGDTDASLIGETFGGEPIAGTDSINTVNCP